MRIEAMTFAIAAELLKKVLCILGDGSVFSVFDFDQYVGILFANQLEGGSIEVQSVQEPQSRSG